MPELPDVAVYIEALERRILGAPLERVRLLTPFLLRSVDPPLSAVSGRTVIGLRRLGKRIVIELEDELFLVIHLMIPGSSAGAHRRSRASGSRALRGGVTPPGVEHGHELSSRRRHRRVPNPDDRDRAPDLGGTSGY